MTRWQYRLKYTNLNWGEERGAFLWRDVGDPPWIGLTQYDALQFRRKPGRTASLAAAIRRLGRSAP